MLSNTCHKCYGPDDIQKLIDILFECVFVATDKKNGIIDMSEADKAAWVSNQLRACGFETEPVGSSWGILR